MDQELRAYLEERFAGMEARLEERFAGMEGRMDERFERVDTEVRHTRVLVEAVQDNVRLLAEGVVGTSERIDALKEETTGRLEEIRGSVLTIHQVLVPRVQSLDHRVKILEDRAERENRDILDVIREKFGVRPSQ